MTIEFQEWPKIARMNRECVVTEKIDGTNAAVIVGDDGIEVYAQSRKRIITPESDNFGFARWVADNAESLAMLGPGHHFGEWYGRGIQRSYGLEDKRFMLFNTARWTDWRPACCEVATVLYQGVFDTDEVNDAVDRLAQHGSKHVPGFDNPEGVVVFHTAANTCFKVTVDKDYEWKGASA